METLDGLDAAFLAIETASVHLHIGAVLVLDPPEGRRSLYSPTTRFMQLRRQIESRLHLAPPLRRRVVSPPVAVHRPVWVDDPEFDIREHVRRIRLPSPGGRAELLEHVGEVMSHPLAHDRPLWEVVVAEGLSGGRTALIFKVHHALLDGVSGAELLAAFLDFGPRPRSFLCAPVAWTPPPVPTPVQVLRHAVGDLVGQPANVLSVAQRTVEAALALVTRNQRLEQTGDSPPPPPFAGPRTCFNGTVGSKRRYAVTEVALTELRAIANQLDATVNDVVLACVSGALRRYLKDREQGVPDSLVAMVPISVRPRQSDTADQVSSMPPASLGNRVSGMFVALPTGESAPVKRVQAVKQSARAAKEQSVHLGDGIVMDLAQVVPTALSSRVARVLGAWRVYDQTRPLANVTVSNVVGPAEALWCAGSRVESLFPVGPVSDGTGLNVTVLTYRGTVHFGLLACSRLVPDLELLVTALSAEADELYTAAVGKRRRTARAG